MLVDEAVSAGAGGRDEPLPLGGDHNQPSGYAQRLLERVWLRPRQAVLDYCDLWNWDDCDC